MTPLAWIGRWLVAFLLTQSVEMGVYVNAPGPERPLRERLAIAFGASAITHPIVWFVITPLYGPLGLTWWQAVGIAEAYAVAMEAVWLMFFGHRPIVAAGAAAIANSLSFGIGLFCYEYLGW